MTEPVVVIELFGIPRQRAGRKEVTVTADTVGAALAALARACPALAGLCRADGTLAPQYLLSRNGERFLTDLGEAVRPGERLLLLSADAGG
jgi:molybdopterin converting factor small subunit